MRAPTLYGYFPPAAVDCEFKSARDYQTTKDDGRDTFDIKASQLLTKRPWLVWHWEAGKADDTGGGAGAVWNGRKQEARQFEPNRAP